MADRPVDPWSGHNHPTTETCGSECPKHPKAAAPSLEGGQAMAKAAGAEVGAEVAKKTAAKKTAAKKTTRPRGNNRASGKSAAQEEGEKSADDATGEPKSEELDIEREEWFRSPGFQRMKTAWEGEDARQMQRVQTVIDKVVFDTFPDAYAVMSDIYDIVREPEVIEGTGEVKKDPYGFVVWKKNPLTGAYYEDWTMLGIKEREAFLFRITTALFDWEQRAADLWTKAMFSKGMFVEKFAIEYDAPIHGTIDDRNARGNKEAAEDRYFALMNSAVSRKAEALVRTMTNLQLRLKDTLGQ